MSNRFYFGAEDSGSDGASANDDDDDIALPFPAPLDRSAFLAPDFDATTFLSNHAITRFQTLEDLQTELRELSQSLNKELVDLVNDNYQDFLSLGSTLSGGEEKIEDVRVGLLGFQRDIRGVRDKIETRREEVQQFLEQKKALRKEIAVGRNLLDIAERLDELEEKLGLSPPTRRPATDGANNNDNTTTTNNTADHKKWSDMWNEARVDDSDEEYENSNSSSGLPPKLARRAEQFLIIKLLSSRHSPAHPFLVAEQGRMARIKEALLLDLDQAVKQEPEIKIKQKILQLRSSVDE